MSAAGDGSSGGRGYGGERGWGGGGEGRDGGKEGTLQLSRMLAYKSVTDNAISAICSHTCALSLAHTLRSSAV